MSGPIQYAAGMRARGRRARHGSHCRGCGREQLGVKGRPHHLQRMAMPTPGALAEACRWWENGWAGEGQVGRKGARGRKASPSRSSPHSPCALGRAPHRSPLCRPTVSELTLSLDNPCPKKTTPSSLSLPSLTKRGSSCTWGGAGRPPGRKRQAKRGEGWGSSEKTGVARGA